MVGGTPQHNLNTFTVRNVTVTAAGTPVQGPTVTVPHGYALVARLQRGQAGSIIAYVAPSSDEASGATAGQRSLIQGNDAIQLWVTNMNALWIDSNTNGAIIELFVEQ